MHEVTLYLIANPLVAIGLSLLVVLCGYNLLRGETRVAMGLWLIVVAVAFYVYVQVLADSAELEKTEMVEPPKVSP